VRLNIRHTWDSDLIVTLVGPDGTTRPLVNRRGGSGDNFSTTTFNDEASVAIASGAAPFNGSFRPEQSLTGYDGKNAAGTWTLRVSDVATFDVGTLNFWELIVTGTAGGTALATSAETPPAPAGTAPASTFAASAPASSFDVAELFLVPTADDTTEFAPTPTTAPAQVLAPAATSSEAGPSTPDATAAYLADETGSVHDEDLLSYFAADLFGSDVEQA
jgi:subtilisin-like proprotein convertase family protein